LKLWGNRYSLYLSTEGVVSVRKEGRKGGGVPQRGQTPHLIFHVVLLLVVRVDPDHDHVRRVPVPVGKHAVDAGAHL
jgi:hypothetical protein